MGYLDRIGFFNLLQPDIEVIPERPTLSRADIFRGSNQNLVEFQAINPECRDDELPSRLEKALVQAFSYRPDRETLGTAAYTVLGELIDNIYEHSSTELDGYVGLQGYQKGGRVRVAVSDSGRGILDTLRPSLPEHYQNIIALSDTDLIVEAFRTGLSRHGTGRRGCGLKSSATHAIRFGADLDVRLPTCRVRLIPSPDGYQPNLAYTYESLPLIWGTHIVFDFRLDGHP